MLIGARTATWCGGGGWTNPYDLGDGSLLAMWDGVWNDGAGNPHNPNATVWEDCVSGIVLTPDTSGFSIEGDAFCISSSKLIAQNPGLTVTNATLQIVAENTRELKLVEYKFNTFGVRTQLSNASRMWPYVLPSNAERDMTGDINQTITFTFDGSVTDEWMGKVKNGASLNNAVTMGEITSISISGVAWQAAKTCPIKSIRLYDKLLSQSEIETLVDVDIERQLY